MGVVYACMAYAVFKHNSHRFFILIAAGALVYLLTDQLAASVVKKYFERLRPCNDKTVDARLLLNNCGAGFSFVSAHAANVFGSVSFLFFSKAVNRLVVAFLVVWAVAVSFSQIYVGVHYPADIIGGALLGVMIAFTITALLKNIESGASN